MKALFLLPVAALALGGCAITTEGTLTEPLKEKPDSVCVIQNPAVAIANSAQIIEKALEKRGVDAVVCASKDDCKSQWHLTYVLYRRWDVVPYLAEGRMDLYPESRLMLTQSLLPEGSLQDPLHQRSALLRNRASSGTADLA